MNAVPWAGKAGESKDVCTVTGCRTIGLVISCSAGTIERLFGFTAMLDRDAVRATGMADIVRQVTARDVQGIKSLSSRHDTPTKPPVKRTAAKAGSSDRDMGTALRTVYQKTIDEAVPDEMLALLGKLN